MARAAVRCWRPGPRASAASLQRNGVGSGTTDAVRGGGFDLQRHRIGLERQQPMRPEDLILIERAARQPRNEQLPHPGLDAFAHRMAPAVPTVEVADHGDALRIRRPDREPHAGDAIDRSSAGHRGSGPIPGGCLRPAGRYRARPAAGRRNTDPRSPAPARRANGCAVDSAAARGNEAGEQARDLQRLQPREHRAVAIDRLDRRRRRQVGAHHGAARRGMRTQQRERVADCGLRPAP